MASGKPPTTLEFANKLFKDFYGGLAKQNLSKAKICDAPKFEEAVETIEEVQYCTATETTHQGPKLHIARIKPRFQGIIFRTSTQVFQKVDGPPLQTERLLGDAKAVQTDKVHLDVQAVQTDKVHVDVQAVQTAKVHTDSQSVQTDHLGSTLDDSGILEDMSVSQDTKAATQETCTETTNRLARKRKLLSADTQIVGDYDVHSDLLEHTRDKLYRDTNSCSFAVMDDDDDNTFNLGSDADLNVTIPTPNLDDTAENRADDFNGTPTTRPDRDAQETKCAEVKKIADDLNGTQATLSADIQETTGTVKTKAQSKDVPRWVRDRQVEDGLNDSHRLQDFLSDSRQMSELQRTIQSQTTKRRRRHSPDGPQGKPSPDRDLQDNTDRVTTNRTDELNTTPPRPDLDKQQTTAAQENIDDELNTTQGTLIIDEHNYAAAEENIDGELNQENAAIEETIHGEANDVKDDLQIKPAENHTEENYNDCNKQTVEVIAKPGNVEVSGAAENKPDDNDNEGNKDTVEVSGTPENVEVNRLHESFDSHNFASTQDAMDHWNRVTGRRADDADIVTSQFRVAPQYNLDRFNFDNDSYVGYSGNVDRGEMRSFEINSDAPTVEEGCSYDGSREEEMSSEPVTSNTEGSNQGENVPPERREQHFGNVDSGDTHSFEIDGDTPPDDNNSGQNVHGRQENDLGNVNIGDVYNVQLNVDEPPADNKSGENETDENNLGENASGETAQDGNLFDCKDCAKRYWSAGALSRHAYSEHSGNVAVHCEECNKWYKDKYRYHEHLLNIHGEPRYYCAVCDTLFQHRNQRRRHIFDTKHGIDLDISE